MAQNQHGTARDGTTYRISELVDVAGVSRDMIKYYLRANLLPPAKKPRPNLSLYTNHHVALIKLVLRFQAQTKLSLAAIAAIFQDARYDTQAIELELLSARHSVSTEDNIIPLHSDGDAGPGLSFPPEFLRQLEHASLTLPEGERDDQLVGLLWAAHEAGVPLGFFNAAQEKLAELAELEVKALITIRRPDLDYGDMLESLSDVDRIINRWLVAEKNHQIRARFQRVIDNSERAISTLLDSLYQPSTLFHTRHNVAHTLATLVTEFNPETASAEQAHALCYSALLLGNTAITIELALARLKLHPGDAMAMACLALAYGIQNDADAAFEYGCRLEHSDDPHTAILQARLLSLLLKAAKLGGVADTTELMKHAAELFLSLPEQPSANQPESVLLLARANVGFPDFANTRTEAIDALNQLLAALDDDDFALSALVTPSLQTVLREVYRISTLFYLGELHWEQDNTDAARACYEAVLQIDPASNFGERAYLRLGTLQP